MYLQAVNPHPTAISTQLCQFCSCSPVSAVHHVPHCCSQTESDHGWQRDIEAVLAWVNREDEEDHDDAPLNHTILKQERVNICGIIWLSLCLLQTFVCLLSVSMTTCKTFKKSKTWNFEASENWAPLTDVVWTETSRTNLTKITSSVSFGLSLDALAGSGVTEDEETTATSGPDEAVRSDGLMEALIYGTGPFPECCCGLLHPHCSHSLQAFQILQRCTNIIQKQSF